MKNYLFSLAKKNPNPNNIKNFQLQKFNKLKYSFSLEYFFSSIKKIIITNI